MKEYVDGLHSTAEEMMELFDDIELSWEDLWTEFISSFRQHTITRCNLAMLKRWTISLKKRDEFIKKGRRVYKAQVLIDILYREVRIELEGKREEHRTTAKKMFTHHYLHPKLPRAQRNISIAPVDSDTRSTPTPQKPTYLDRTPNTELPKFYTHKTISKVEIDRKGPYTRHGRKSLIQLNKMLPSRQGSSPDIKHQKRNVSNGYPGDDDDLDDESEGDKDVTNGRDSRNHQRKLRE